MGDSAIGRRCPVVGTSMDLIKERPMPRRFHLVRYEDPSNFSGVGVVASGCQWDDGTVVMHWNTELRSTTVFVNIETLIAIHGMMLLRGTDETYWP
jgi:hypothetical protein